MMLAYRYMDSQPMHGNQVPHVQYCHPSFDAVQPHMRTDDSSKSAAFYGPWPNANSFGYSIPCHTCWSHGNFPAYCSPTPPCPHFATPQYQYCGHPPYHGVFPVQYVPPPNYSMEHPRYEYDKGLSRDRNYHCCECPNHPQQHRSNGSVKLELDPDAQKEGHSLVPSFSENCPHPVVWIPPDYLKKNEHKKLVESEMASWEKAPQERLSYKNVKPSEQDSRLLNGWFPLDIKSVMQDDDKKRTQSNQNDDKTQQFPFPLVWMPFYNKRDDADKEGSEQRNASTKPVKELPSSINFLMVQTKSK